MPAAPRNSGWRGDYSDKRSRIAKQVPKDIRHVPDQCVELGMPSLRVHISLAWVLKGKTVEAAHASHQQSLRVSSTSLVRADRNVVLGPLGYDTTNANAHEQRTTHSRRTQWGLRIIGENTRTTFSSAARPSSPILFKNYFQVFQSDVGLLKFEPEKHDHTRILNS